MKAVWRTGALGGLLLAVFFLGLGFRSFLDRKTKQVTSASSGQFRILLIGDSVLGLLNQDGSIARELAKELENMRSGFSVESVSVPGNMSARVLESIHQTLDVHKPQLVVLMLGNSDWILPNVRLPASWISKAVRVVTPLGLEKPMIFAGHQLQIWADRWMAVASMFGLSRPQQHESRPSYDRRLRSKRMDLIREAWGFYDRNQLYEAIGVFEALAQIDPEARRALLVLNSCYHRTRQFQRGIDFFSTLAKKSREAPLLEQLSLALKVAVRDVSSMDFKIPYPVDRDSYISALWITKNLGRVEQANALFLNSEPFASLQDGSLDVPSYRNIIEATRKTGAMVLALQYPNQVDWPVQQAISSFSKGVSYFSLRFEFMRRVRDAPIEESVINLFQDDFMHVTPQGAHILGEALAKHILFLRESG